jgi:hypothetical protein
MPPTINNEIKPVMKSIHVIVKETSQRLSSSPWSHYLDQPNSVGAGGRPFATHTASSSVASTAGLSLAGSAMGPPPLPVAPREQQQQQGSSQRSHQGQHQHQHSAGSIAGSTGSLGPPVEITRRGGSDGANGLVLGRNGGPAAALPPPPPPVANGGSNGTGAGGAVDGGGGEVGGSVPSTPLGAALGPAAAAAALQGKPSAGRAAINVFERIDRLERERVERSASQPRQPELLYTKKAAN